MDFQCANCGSCCTYKEPIPPKPKVFTVYRSLSSNTPHCCTMRVHSLHTTKDTARAICKALLLDGFAVQLVESELQS